MLFTFFTFSSSSIDTMLGYVGGFITDITPIMLPILAIGLGIFIVSAIIGSFRH
jgi:hypothetical protein